MTEQQERAAEIRYWHGECGGLFLDVVTEGVHKVDAPEDTFDIACPTCGEQHVLKRVSRQAHDRYAADTDDCLNCGKQVRRIDGKWVHDVEEQDIEAPDYGVTSCLAAATKEEIAERGATFGRSVAQPKPATGVQVAADAERGTLYEVLNHTVGNVWEESVATSCGWCDKEFNEGDRVVLYGEPLRGGLVSIGSYCNTAHVAARHDRKKVRCESASVLYGEDNFYRCVLDPDHDGDLHFPKVGGSKSWTTEQEV